MLAVLEDKSSSSDDNRLAPLEPVVERACSTDPSFIFITFDSCLGGVLSECCTEKDEKELPVSRRLINERIQI